VANIFPPRGKTFFLVGEKYGRGDAIIWLVKICFGFLKITPKKEAKRASKEVTWINVGTNL
jgi:hypothetical protein